MNKTKFFIFGALSGFIVTEFDKVFMREVSPIPIGSIIFVFMVGAMGIIEYFENKETLKFPKEIKE
jgi:hypothetical protein